MPLVTFDFHNTLAHCDTWFQLEVFHITSTVAHRLGIPDDPESLDADYRVLRRQVMESGVEISASQGVSTVLTGRGHEIDDYKLNALVDTVIFESAHDLEATDGALETVTSLRDLGYDLGVISSAAHHEFVETSLVTLGLRSSFDFVLTSVRAGMYKSNPDIYRMALGTANAVAEHSLHVGDSLKWDVGSAQAVGMKTAWVQSPQSRGSDAKPDLVLPSLVGASPVIHEFMQALQ